MNQRTDQFFFTSDHHAYHKNIIQLCNRRTIVRCGKSTVDRTFDTVFEMMDDQVRKWNAVVRPTDIVYHLGDAVLGTVEQAKTFFGRLNGNIFILTNVDHHDRRWIQKTQHTHEIKSAQGTPLTFLPPLLMISPDISFNKKTFRQNIVLCHYPLSAWNKSHFGSWMLHGHEHVLNEFGRGLVLNVGVDLWDRPVSLSEVAIAVYQKIRGGVKNPNQLPGKEQGATRFLINSVKQGGHTCQEL